MGDKLLELLLQHIGRGAAISAADIAAKLGVPDSGGSPQTRQLITELLRQGIPVASSEAGYFVAETDAEAIDYKLALEERARGIVARIHAFDRAWTNRKHPQKQETLVRWVAEPEEEACHL